MVGTWNNLSPEEVSDKVVDPFKTPLDQTGYKISLVVLMKDAWRCKTDRGSEHFSVQHYEIVEPIQSEYSFASTARVVINDSIPSE